MAAFLMATVPACKQTIPIPVKVTDCLYEITLSDYPSEAPDHNPADFSNEAHCSSVRNGIYYGRNMDFLISEIPTFVVHTTAAPGRHATMGICRVPNVTDRDIEAGLTDEQLTKLPWIMYDGINDAGLFCNVNVTPAADCGIPHTSPNPGKPDITNTFLIRALLDNCASVEEAVEYVNNHNVKRGTLSNGLEAWDLHYMIGDSQRTVVLEFLDNKAVFKDNEIMTNFFVNLLPEYTPNADGIERYNILKEHYAEGGESMEGMWNLMRSVRYSQAYDPATEPFWNSEFHAEPEEIQVDIDNFRNFKETGHYTPEMGLWRTEHNSVYNVADKILWVTIHEDYDNRYEFRF